MSDSVTKGIGEQLGNLAKQVVKDVAKVPAQIAGLDETLGLGSGKGQSSSHSKTAKAQKTAEESQKIANIARQDEAEKQKKLALARQLLAQFTKPKEQPEQSIREKMELEELEQKRKEIVEERIKAAKVLKKIFTKPKRGNLFGMAAKQQGSELGKNVKSG